MKISVEYKDAAEKVKFLENVVTLFKEKPESLEKAAEAFTQHLMLVAKEAYVQGGVRKDAEANAKVHSAAADGLFGEVGGAGGPEEGGTGTAE